MKKSNRDKQPHQEARAVTRNQMAVERRQRLRKALREAENANNRRMVRKQIGIPADWQKTKEGYTYEKTIPQVNNIDCIIKKVLKGSVIGNHAILSLHTYRKYVDVGALSELQKEERILEDKLSSYVIRDPEYDEIAQKLYETKSQIRAIKHDLGTNIETKTLLEDWYSGDLGSNDHIEWQEKFMQNTLITAEQAQGAH